MLAFNNRDAQAVHVEFGSDVVSLCEEIVKLRTVKNAAKELLADCDHVDFSSNGLFPKRAKSMSELRKAMGDLK